MSRRSKGRKTTANVLRAKIRKDKNKAKRQADLAAEAEKLGISVFDLTQIKDNICRQELADLERRKKFEEEARKREHTLHSSPYQKFSWSF